MIIKLQHLDDELSGFAEGEIVWVLSEDAEIRTGSVKLAGTFDLWINQLRQWIGEGSAGPVDLCAMGPSGDVQIVARKNIIEFSSYNTGPFMISSDPWSILQCVVEASRQLLEQSVYLGNFEDEMLDQLRDTLGASL